MLKYFCVINFHGFHYPRKYFNNEILPDYSIIRMYWYFHYYKCSYVNDDKGEMNEQQSNTTLKISQLQVSQNT